MAAGRPIGATDAPPPAPADAPPAETPDADTAAPATETAAPAIDTSAASEPVAESPPAPEPRYKVGSHLGPWQAGEILKHSQLKALGTPDDRILDLQLQGLLVEVAD